MFYILCHRKLETCQVLFLNVDLKQCSNIASTDANVTVFLYFVDINGDYDESLVTEFDQGQLQSPFKVSAFLYNIIRNCRDGLC